MFVDCCFHVSWDIRMVCGWTEGYCVCVTRAAYFKSSNQGLSVQLWVSWFEHEFPHEYGKKCSIVVIVANEKQNAWDHDSHGRPDSSHLVPLWWGDVPGLSFLSFVGCVQAACITEPPQTTSKTKNARPLLQACLQKKRTNVNAFLNEHLWKITG